MSYQTSPYTNYEFFVRYWDRETRQWGEVYVTPEDASYLLDNEEVNEISLKGELPEELQSVTDIKELLELTEYLNEYPEGYILAAACQKGLGSWSFVYKNDPLYMDTDPEDFALEVLFLLFGLEDIHWVLQDALDLNRLFNHAFPATGVTVVEVCGTWVALSTNNDR